MATRTRRGGCGCLSLVLVVFLIGSLLAVGLAWREEVALGAVFAIGAGLAVLAGLVIALVSRARRIEEEDAGQYRPQPERPVAARPSQPTPSRSDREVRSGARHLSTEPESDEARALKRRLTEAVSDLADNVEEMPARKPGEQSRRLTSDEMIDRAKRRIREWADDPNI